MDMRDSAELGYTDFDRERFLPEVRNQATRRSEFARDRARVVHSSALRRLGAKTQVLSPSGGDFARTRLTHSLEVAQIGREMAIDLGVSADVVDMACLAHDLGHPPFGHNGEKALNEWSADFGGFEGNAQTLRLLTRIEPKVFNAEGKSLGLNLTRAGLDATCKYPWRRDAGVEDSGADQSLKFGAYEDDLEVFNWLRIDAPLRQKCVEAQIMDFADDVAYSVHDFEDAIVSGFVDLEVLNDPAAEAEILRKVKDWSGEKHSLDELEQALVRLRGTKYWISHYAASNDIHGHLKNLTSELIGRFVSATIAAVIDTSPRESLARFGSTLSVPRTVSAEIAILKGVVSAFLMTIESRKPYYEWQRGLLIELAEAVLASNGEILDAYCSSAWRLANDEKSQRRVVIDQVASLTDQSAITLHHRLVASKQTTAL